MKEIINQIKHHPHKDVLIIGDIMLDEYIFGSVTRISPEAPVPILKEEHRAWSLGGAANVALNCKQLGSSVQLIGLTGTNGNSTERLLSMLHEHDINTDGICQSTRRVTTTKKRLMAQHNQLMRIDHENTDPLHEEERVQIVESIHRLIASHSIIVVSDYAKGVIDANIMKEIIRIAAQHNSLVLVDPKGPDFSKYTGATYIKPNAKEFGEMISFFGLSPHDNITDNARAVCHKLNLSGIIVTQGENGIQFISEKENVFVPSIEQEVFDLTGAGDTVIAFLAVGLTCRVPMKQCLQISNKAAAIAISHIKTYAVSLDELADHHEETVDKYYETWQPLKERIDTLKQDNKRIVFTNGCFDILHTGHLHHLKESKKLGDILVIGINTDASIKRVKDPSRPLKPLNERAHVLAALGMVDFVVPFEEDTPLELIKYLKPDVLTKGVDYQAHEVVGYHEVTSYGGEVVIIGWKNEHSTTSLLSRHKTLRDQSPAAP